MRFSELKLFLVPLVGFLLLLGAYVATGRLEANSATISQWAGAVTVDSPQSLNAGETMTVKVQANANDNTPVQLAFFAPVNNGLLKAFLIDGTAEFEVPEAMLRHAGIVRIAAQVGASQSEPVVLQILPLAPVDPVVPLVGPRTIIADGVDNTMAVVSPTDTFGNPVVTGTEVAIELLRPSGDRSTIVESVERGLAATIIGSTTEAGRLVISATTSGADGPANPIDQVAGIPANFAVEADTRNALADGFTLHQVQTSTLRDRFGNVLPDGLSAIIVVEDERGTSLIQAVVQGGVARVFIEAPNQAGELRVRARVSGAESPELVLAFGEAVESFPAAVASDGTELVITVGPVLTTRGGYVPDGTEVSIQRSGTGETIGQGAFRTGVSEIIVDLAVLGPTFDVTSDTLAAVVLGTTEAVRFGGS